ncbi:MAG: amino acid permease [Chryseolinea sp.]
MTQPRPSEKIGLLTSTALVVGNMIGSGIFLLPVALASFGAISFVGWFGSCIGAIALALLFSKLSKLMPYAQGGPYAYTREGMGDFAAFLVAWGYWLSIWCCNAAIVVTFVSYLTVFFPALATNSFLAVGRGLATIWLLTWVNTRGIKTVGVVQVVTTVLKLTPLILVTVAGLFFIQHDHFTPFNVSTQPDLSAVTTTITLTLFAFLGLESATVPSENIRDPAKTIPRATMLGIFITMGVYVLGSFAVMGIVPPDQLSASNAPFADAAAIIWGDGARGWVAFGALASTFGALNGWILLQGQLPLAAARDKIFPEIFGRLNSRGIPALGLSVGSALISALIAMNFTKGLTATFTFIVFLGTVTVLLPYLFSATSYGLIIMQNKYWKRDDVSKVILAAVAFFYSIWAIGGSGQEAVYWGFLAILGGLPFYVWMKNRKMKIHAICTDIDGTLLNKNRELSVRTIQAIKAIKDKVPVILASSRMPSAMSHLQAQLGITHHPMICYNGGYILRHLSDNVPEVLDSVQIPFSICDRIVELARTLPVHVSLYANDEWFAAAEDRWTGKEEAVTKVSPQIINLEHVLSRWKSAGTGGHKIMLMGEKSDIAILYQKLEDFFRSDVHIYRSKETYLELASKKISKSSALKMVLDRWFGSSMSNAMAFGDNYNDIEMIRSVGLGIVVSNARPEVKAVAASLTLDSKEDGVAIALEKYFDAINSK